MIHSCLVCVCEWVWVSVWVSKWVSVSEWVSEWVWVSVSECEWVSVSEWVWVSECEWVWVSECEWVSECVSVCWGGRTGRRRRSGYRTKNKNPTRQCGEKHSVSRLSYLFAHLHLLSSDSFSSDLLSSNLSLLSASALLCFSSVHIVGSLTSKLPSIIRYVL